MPVVVMRGHLRMTGHTHCAASILVAAGCYQWSAVKEACLTHCRSPLEFLDRQGGYRRDAAGAWTLGVTHGM